MKKVFIFFIILFISKNANAASLEEQWKELGTVAGLAYACDSKKLDEYEVIVSALIRAKTKSDNQESQAVVTYAKSKLNSFNRQKKYPKLGCGEINLRFSKQKIFQSKVLSDGRIKTPEGKWLKPRKPFKKNEKLPPVNQTAPTPRFEKSKNTDSSYKKPTVRRILNKKWAK